MALYQNVIPLDKEQHKNHKLKLITSFDFAADVQSVPLIATEFAEAHKEYPIVFVKSGEAQKEIMPIALLGIRTGQNLYVDANGKWNARYIPAFIRRYPFIFAESGNDRMTLLVDKDYPGFGTEEGKELFDENGESEFLKEQLNFMSAFHQQALMTRNFIARLESLGLLKDMNARVDLNDGRKFVVQDFLVIDEEKLKALDMHEVLRFFVSGELALIYAHLMSLSNLNKLVDLTAERGEDTIH